MGVMFEEMGAEQQSAIQEWLRGLARHPGKASRRNAVSAIRG
jgi:hypothetical protein